MKWGSRRLLVHTSKGLPLWTKVCAAKACDTVGGGLCVSVGSAQTLGAVSNDGWLFFQMSSMVCPEKSQVYMIVLVTFL